MEGEGAQPPPSLWGGLSQRLPGVPGGGSRKTAFPTVRWLLILSRGRLLCLGTSSQSPLSAPGIFSLSFPLEENVGEEYYEER